MDGEPLPGKARAFCSKTCIGEFYHLEGPSLSDFAAQHYYRSKTEECALSWRLQMEARIDVALLLAGTDPSIAVDDPYAYTGAWKEFLVLARPYILQGADKRERRLRYDRVRGCFVSTITRMMTLQAARIKGLETSHCTLPDCKYRWPNLLLHLTWAHGDTRDGNVDGDKEITIGAAASSPSAADRQQILRELEKCVCVACRNCNYSCKDTVFFKA